MVSAALANTFSAHSSRSCSAFFWVSLHTGSACLLARQRLSPAFVAVCAPSLADAHLWATRPTTAGLASRASAMARKKEAADARSDPPG